jgi:hypothetical protein
MGSVPHVGRNLVDYLLEDAAGAQAVIDSARARTTELGPDDEHAWHAAEAAAGIERALWARAIDEDDVITTMIADITAQGFELGDEAE